MTPHLRGGQSYAGRSIGLFGGSFNPAHEGHQAMALFALKQLHLDEIWLLVSPLNPMKKGSQMASLAKRVAQTELLVSHPGLKVTSIEEVLGTTYTSSTLRKLKRRFPATRFVWLMGADNLRQIHCWKQWQSIFCSVPVAVFRRPAYAAGRGLGKAALRFDRAWHAPSSASLLKRCVPPAWTILDNKLNGASSTQIRKENPSW